MPTEQVAADQDGGLALRELLAAATTRLTAAGVESARVDAELLLAHVLDLDRGRLVLAPPVPTDRAVRFRELIDRRASRVPLQHLTGTAAFRHVQLAVGPGVFVPRPETEVMAGWAIEQLRSVAGRPIMLEMCAGSGAISAAVLDELPGVRVYAVELDEAAYGYAERNLADALSAGRARLALADMADSLRVWPELTGQCDAVVANPPYIPLDAYESVAPEARDHDPALALWSGRDGLDAIRTVAGVAADALRVGGWVACEHADVQGDTAPAVFAASGRYDQVRDRPDLAGRPRFVTARRG